MVADNISSYTMEIFFIKDLVTWKIYQNLLVEEGGEERGIQETG